MSKILVLGTGNFSKLLQRLLRSDFELKALNVLDVGDEELAEDMRWAEAVIFAIPFKGYEATIDRIAPSLKSETLVIDISSVKVKPQRALHNKLPNHKNWLITHPLFGPQSAADGTEGLQFVVCEEEGDLAKQFIDFCELKLKLKVIRMTSEEHDLQMSKAQALTFLVSETLRGIDINEQELMTPSYRKLLEVRQLIDHETQDLLDLLQYDNEFASDMRKLFVEQAAKINTKYDGIIKK